MTVSDKYKDELFKINEQIVALANEKKNLNVTSEDYRDLVREEIKYQNQVLNIVKELD